MKKYKGFTRIEVVSAIILIILFIAVPTVFISGIKKQHTNTNVCINGFIMLTSGKQLLDEYGNGVKCESVSVFPSKTVTNSNKL